MPFTAQLRNEMSSPQLVINEWTKSLSSSVRSMQKLDRVIKTRRALPEPSHSGSAHSWFISAKNAAKSTALAYFEHNQEPGEKHSSIIGKNFLLTMDLLSLFLPLLLLHSFSAQHEMSPKFMIPRDSESIWRREGKAARADVMFDINPIDTGPD